jgi:cytochrome c
MSDQFNTFAGWALAAGIVVVGLNSVTSRYYAPHRPHELGYVIEGAEETGGGASGPSLAELLSTADIAAGEKSFSKCAACHTIEQGGAAGIGPNLFGVVGTTIASHAPGFAYSPALAGHGGDWNFENLDAWLQSPRRFADGTKMSFAGLGNAEERANMIAYMNSMGSNLPMPEVVVEEPAAEEAVAEEGVSEEAPAEEAAAE